MKYMIMNGQVMARSRSELPGSWQVFDWSTGRWDEAPFMEVGLSLHWHLVTAAEALLLAAGAQPDDRFAAAEFP